MKGFIKKIARLAKKRISVLGAVLGFFILVNIKFDVYAAADYSFGFSSAKDFGIRTDEEGSWLIKDESEYRRVVLCGNTIGYKGVNIILEEDIVFTEPIDPMGLYSMYPFEGVFEGGGHTLYNVSFKNPKRKGIFRYVEANNNEVVEIRNLSVQGEDPSGMIFIGQADIESMYSKKAVLKVVNCKVETGSIMATVDIEKGSGMIGLARVISIGGKSDLIVEGCEFAGLANGDAAGAFIGYVQGHGVDSGEVSIVINKCKHNGLINGNLGENAIGSLSMAGNKDGCVFNIKDCEGLIGKDIGRILDLRCDRSLY